MDRIERIERDLPAPVEPVAFKPLTPAEREASKRRREGARKRRQAAKRPPEPPAGTIDVRV
jgi:hypothetical protein